MIIITIIIIIIITAVNFIYFKWYVCHQILERGKTSIIGVLVAPLKMPKIRL